MIPRKLPRFLPANWPDYAFVPTENEWESALEEDRIVERALKRAHRRPFFMIKPTRESIREGNKIIAKGRSRSRVRLQNLVESGELVITDEILSD